MILIIGGEKCSKKNAHFLVFLVISTILPVINNRLTGFLLETAYFTPTINNMLIRCKVINFLLNND